MQDEVQPIDDLFRLALHVVLDPVEHEADEGVFIDVGDERLVLRADGHAGRLLLHHALEQVIGELVEVIFHLLAADGVVDIHDEGLVGQHGLKDLLKALLPGLVGLLPSQGLGRVLLAGPLDKVIDVLEVVVERHAVDAAVIGDVADGDLVERLLQQQILERLLQSALGEFRHGDLLWVG